jgi:hypothetical protein
MLQLWWLGRKLCNFAAWTVLGTRLPVVDAPLLRDRPRVNVHRCENRAAPPILIPSLGVVQRAAVAAPAPADVHGVRALRDR